MIVRCSLDSDSIGRAIERVKKYRDWVAQWPNRVGKRLADLGYQVVITILNDHVWSGETLNNLSVEKVGEGQFVLTTSSQAILFFEFGAGVVGYGHPLAATFGFGPGTYPPTNPDDPKWDDAGGWWFVKDGRRYHTYGNPPYMPFYQADVKIKENLLLVCREELQMND